MNTQSPMTNFSSADPPLKRKRGRPRKDESLMQAETVVPTTPIEDSMKRNKQCAEPEINAAAVDEMVGQVVSGVIEGSFDAGYLLKVKVGDNDTHLRGVVFLPGRFAPLTASNDLAPEVKMHRRTEMPIPVQSPPAEQCDKQATEAQNFTPMLEDQVQGLTSDLRPIVPIVPESQQVAAVLPLTDNLPPMSSTGSMSIFGGGVAPQQILGSGLGSSSASQMGHDDLLKEFEASLTKVANANAVASEQLKSTPPSVPSTDHSPDRTVNLELHIQHQATEDDLKPSQAEHEVKSQNIEQIQSLIPAETVGITTWMEKPDSPSKPAPPELQTISGNDTSKLNGNVERSESHAADNAETESTSEPITSLPVTLFETDLPKPATEGSILQMMIQPELCMSSGTEKIMKVDAHSTPVNLFERVDHPPSESESESKLVSDVPSLPMTNSNVNPFDRADHAPSELKLVSDVHSAPLTSLNVNLFGRADHPPSESKLVSDVHSTPVTSLNVNLFDRTDHALSESKLVSDIHSAPVTSLNVNLFDRADHSPSESKLVSDKPEPQPRFCSSSGMGEGRDSTNRIVGD